LSIYHLSYTLYTLTGLTVVLTVGMLVSYLTGGQDLDKLDPDHLTPPIKYFYLKSRRTQKRNSSSKNVETRNGDVENPKLLEQLLKNNENENNVEGREEEKSDTVLEQQKT
jgi:hypothetical protein